MKKGKAFLSSPLFCKSCRILICEVTNLFENLYIFEKHFSRRSVILAKFKWENFCLAPWGEVVCHHFCRRNHCPVRCRRPRFRSWSPGTVYSLPTFNNKKLQTITINGEKYYALKKKGGLKKPQVKNEKRIAPKIEPKKEPARSQGAQAKGGGPFRRARKNGPYSKTYL